jgi:hypothetical protein
MSKFSRQIAGILVVTLLSAPLLAADKKVAVNIKKDSPDSYVVQANDTLWDIASRFLKSPWQWPDVWRGDQQIYPGDTIMLGRDAKGKPVLTMKSGASERVVKLSPRIRVEQLEMPIPVIPLNAIHQFLTRPYVVEPGELDDAPYIVSAGKHRILASPPGQKIYLRENGRHLSGHRFFVVRPGKLYKHAESGEVLGQEAIYVGEVEKIRRGDPATAVVLQTEIEMKPGDRLIASSDEEVITRYYPHAPEEPTHCAIINTLSGISKMGRYDVVALDCGEDAGVVPGDVLTIDQRGDTIYDPFFYDKQAPDRRIDSRHKWMGELEEHHAYGRMEKWTFPDPNSRLELPDEPVGTLMVFRTFPHVSFALIMQSTDAISLLDKVRNPDL